MEAGVAEMFAKYLDIVFNHINEMERIHWIGLSVIVLVIGFGCMRGLNTRM